MTQEQDRLNRMKEAAEERTTPLRLIMKMKERLIQGELVKEGIEAPEGVELDLDSLQTQLRRALEEPEVDTDKVNGITSAISVAAAHKAEAGGIYEKYDNFAEAIYKVFEEHDVPLVRDLEIAVIDEEDIDWFLERPRGEIVEEGEEVEPKGKEEEKLSRYLRPTLPHTAESLIARDEEGFVFKYLKGIGIANLRPELRDDEKKVHSAAELTRQRKVTLQEGIETEAKELGARKVRTFVEKRRARIEEDNGDEDPNMTPFYDDISDTEGPYAGMRIGEFTEDVLGRFDRKKKDREIQKPKERRVRPRDWDEKTEVDLAGRLTRGQNLELIYGEVVGADNPDQLAEEKRGNINRECEELAVIRGSKPPELTKQDKKRIPRIISDSVREMADSTRGWHMVAVKTKTGVEPTAFNLVKDEVVGAVRGSEEPGRVVSRFMDIIYPEKVIVTDQHGRVLKIEPKNGENNG